MNLLKLFKNNQAIILVLIAIFPLFGYICSYFFQVGYFSFFDIPQEIISVNIEDAFYPTILTGIVLWLFLFVTYFLPIPSYKPKRIFSKIVFFPTLILTIFSAALFIIYFSQWYGSYSARRTDEFYVIKNNGSDYLLFVQGNGLYSAVKLNKKRTKTEDEIILLPSDSKLILKRVIIPNLNQN